MFEKQLNLIFSFHFPFSSLKDFKSPPCLLPAPPTPIPLCLPLSREADEILNGPNWVSLTSEGKMNMRGWERTKKLHKLCGKKDSRFHMLCLTQNTFSVLFNPSWSFNITLWHLVPSWRGRQHKDLTSVCWEKAGMQDDPYMIRQTHKF